MATPDLSGSDNHSPSSDLRQPVSGTVPQGFRSVRLDIGGEEPLEVVNFRTELPAPATVKQRGVFVRAAEGAGLLNEDGRHAVARALVRPDIAAPLIKNGLLVPETVEKAILSQVTGYVWTTELWPLLQPRTEAESLTVPRPKIAGALDDSGKPLAQLVLTFASLQHLADYMHQTIVHTRRTGNDYAPSILARRVGRAVLAHAVQLDFEDGTEPFTVLAVRDGLTRIVSAMAARLGQDASPDKVATQMIKELLAVAAPRAGRKVSVSQNHARGREQVTDDLRARFATGTVGPDPSEDAIRIGQTFTLPAQIYVAVEAMPTTLLPANEIFSEAIRAVVGSIHTEFRGWDPAAQAIDVGERALARTQHTGRLGSDVVRLAVGTLGADQTSRIFGDTRIPDTPLWRAVYLVNAVCQPLVYASMKTQLRSLLGMTKIHNKRFVSYLGPMVDIPWRAAKVRSLQQARRAWAGGGPIPFTLLGSDWEPVPTEDFLDLVPRALNGDANARRTLQVAGGIALVADRLLASNIGSALQSGVVPFRADPHDIITNLGATDNEAGLYQLAYAAQVFRADQPAINSFSDRELQNATSLTGYVVPRVDDSNPSQLLRDATQQPLALTQFELVSLSDPARALGAIPDADTADGNGFTMPQSTEARAKVLREGLTHGLEVLEDHVSTLLELASSGDTSVGPAFGSREEWTDLSARAQRVSSHITLNPPPENDSESSDFVDEDDELDEAESIDE